PDSDSTRPPVDDFTAKEAAGRAPSSRPAEDVVPLQTATAALAAPNDNQPSLDSLKLAPSVTPPSRAPLDSGAPAGLIAEMQMADLPSEVAPSAPDQAGSPQPAAEQPAPDLPQVDPAGAALPFDRAALDAA